MKYLHPHIIHDKIHINFGFEICKLALNSPWKCYGSDIFNGARLMCPMEHKLETITGKFRIEVWSMVRSDLYRVDI